jgi:cell division protein FtsB
VRGGKTTERPWENRIKSRQDASRQRYLDYAAELQRSGAARDDALARQIRQFIEDMPAVETRRQVLKKELSKLADSRRRGAEQGVNADRRGETRGDERTR